ncbi:hypothetical protein RRV45_08170 [Bacillus sp. DTU_2020_1000418_1_SI_GHA_SEK_038]|nr:hypothetical protein [Bacillus sp. DTU_2020_1000418_1_SI_GHA_SEK_038]WNS76945.1 hypothetical protein RRV45_08170 [Bacillus sp. DTU_2020_1000418_1_SI_GHA_SEK_038]
MDKNKEKQKNANVEFGIEFGDMNASKLYEVPFMSKDKEKKNNRKKKY